MVAMNELIEFLIHKFAQEDMDPNAVPPPIDPNAIQQGQPVYDEQGQEYLVAENDPMTPSMVLVDPTQDAVSGTETVDNQDISNRFTVQDNLDPNNPDPNVTASVDSGFIREKSTLGLISRGNFNPIECYEITQQNHKVSNELDNGFNTETFDPQVDFPEFNQDPKNGYTEIKRYVQNLVAQNYSDTDIILLVGENFEKTFAERVLSDLRDRGAF